MYSTNITPDPDTGIGHYTYEDFERAVRKGVAKDGHHLYPAMPYPSYAKLTDDDVHALYDFFMKEVPPAKQANRANEIPNWLSFRWPLAIWNVLFTDSGTYKQKSDHDAKWNRGAYLVESLGHCGACHTPRGPAFEEKGLDSSDKAFLSGANLDGWSAPNLHNDARTGLGQWSEAELVEFLKTGHNRFGTAFGSMSDVVNNSTPYMSDDDIAAIASYLKSLAPTESQPAYTYDAAATTALKSGKPGSAGGQVYLARCAACHGADGKGAAPYLPPIAGNPTLLDKDPVSLINVVLNGSAPLVVRGTPDAYRMPQFRVQMSDQEVADVVMFIRDAWGNKTAGTVTAKQVADLRKSTDPKSDSVVILKMR